MGTLASAVVCPSPHFTVTNPREKQVMQDTVILILANSDRPDEYLTTVDSVDNVPTLLHGVPVWRYTHVIAAPFDGSEEALRKAWPSDYA